MAKIRTRKRGKTYSYIFEAGKKPDGKRKVVEKGGFSSVDEAYIAGVQAFNDWKHGSIGITSDKVKLKDFFASWLKNVVPQNVRPSTLAVYTNVYGAHILPQLGRFYLQDLTPALIDRWLMQEKQKGLAYGTLQNMKRLLQEALNYAVYPAQLINSNPATYIHTPRNAPRAKIKRSIISRDQLDKLLAAYATKNPAIRLVILILYCTGLRIGEALGLCWHNIDFAKHTITIDHQTSRIGTTFYFAPPKTKSSNRTICIDDTLLVELKKWHMLQAAAYTAGGGSYIAVYYHAETGKLVQQSKNLPISNQYKQADLVCTNIKNGRKVVYPTLQRHLKRLGINAHSFRHTHATILIENGATPKGVASRLGHTKADITHNLYTHNTPKLQQDTANIFQHIMHDGQK